MKKITIICLILILTLPVLLQAQYLGGDGRGDVMVSLTNITISVKEITVELPTKYSLSQNYPNPFNSSSKFKFQNSKLGDVKIVVYDIMGREVQTLVNETLKPGTYEATFDGSALNSGVYFYKLSVADPTGRNGFTETKKMLMIK